MKSVVISIVMMMIIIIITRAYNIISIVISIMIYYVFTSGLIVGRNIQRKGSQPLRSILGKKMAPFFQPGC